MGPTPSEWLSDFVPTHFFDGIIGGVAVNNGPATAPVSSPEGMPAETSNEAPGSPVSSPISGTCLKMLSSDICI